MKRIEFDETTVIEAIKKHQVTETWVNNSREQSQVLRALVNGRKFHELLIDQIEGIESAIKAKARKRYSKDIRDVFHRVMSKRDNVFQATGGTEEIDIPSEPMKEQFIANLNNFKGGKSINKYFSEYFFRQLDTDPNGVIFLEYTTDPELKVYPTFKSIDVIRTYVADGQKCEYLIFEPKKVLENGNERTYWRVVDAKTDWTILQTNETFIVIPDKTFEHPFGEVPAVILSDQFEIGHRERLSPINPIIELSKDYARDKSILSIYKFQNGFPKNWQYVSRCRECHGTGKTGETKCTTCAGTGVKQRNDVTDIINIELPKESDPVIAPNISGFIQPDLDTWKQYKEDLADLEAVMEHTIWGTHEIKSGNETATGRYIDVQPITNELNNLADRVQWIHNVIANWTANAIVLTKDKVKDVYLKSYGRRFIIESPDVILERYEKSRASGINNTILDKLMQEFILSKYKSDPIMQELMTKKAIVEPYVHYSIEQVFTIFGKKEAYKKAIFDDFWEQVDIKKAEDQLKTDFTKYWNEKLIENKIEEQPINTNI